MRRNHDMQEEDMRLQGRIIGLNRTQGEVLDFAVEGQPDRTLFRSLQRKVAQLNVEMGKKSKKVDELKTTLNVVLRKRDEDMAVYEEKLLYRLKQMIMPYLEMLDGTKLNGIQKQCVCELKKNIEGVSFTFSPSFIRQCRSLTPVEIRVVGMIKQGKTTKEIADFLYLSTRTIESHRRNIRKKLGLNNRKVNLMTHFMANPA
jgi:DNA-binding CsgD family transcriptional regulator